MQTTIRNEDDYNEYCRNFRYRLEEYIKNLDTGVLWWFDIGACDTDKSEYSLLFKSYITDEYKDYSLSIVVTKRDSDYEFKVCKIKTS